MNSTFKPPDWTHSTNIYEVNLRQYTNEGTFNAFAKHLPRLKNMGVETLWFMPIHPIGLQNRKGTLGSYYSIQDYLDINPDHGTLEDFKELIHQAHEMGFKIMIDWVANHTSWDHVWTKTNPEFFTKDDHGNFRPPYPEWEDVIKLNYDNAEMRKAMIDAMKFWVDECDIDGYRCDMAHLVPLDFWREARKQVDAMKPLFWLAETEEVNYHEVFDASYTWEFLHMMEKYWRRETDIGGLDFVLNKYKQVFPKDALRIYFASNHDENSHSGSEYQRMGDAAKAFAVLCTTWDGIPLIYSGQELPNHRALAFFEKDPIEWKEKTEQHEFYKTLLTLHKNNSALRAGDPSTTQRLRTSTDDKIFSFLRKNGKDEALVILNLSVDSFQFSIHEDLNGKFKEIFTGVEKDFGADKNLEMGAWQWYVFENTKGFTTQSHRAQ
jgi:alpha-amylase